MSAPLLVLLLIGAAAQANHAAPGRPAVIQPLVEPTARCSANPQLVVALTGFTPPNRGVASVVVSLRMPGGRLQRLGEAGVFPHQPFSGSLANAHRFGFPVPRSVLARNPSVVVEVSNGGKAVVGEARITPAPQERCARPRR